MSDGLEILQKELETYQDTAKKYYNFEQAVKLILNSIYGAFGNSWFYFFNVNIAESITKQGKNAIQFTEKAINYYFFNIWEKDFEVHQKMGIKVTGKIVKPVAIYSDTDSLFLSLEEVLKKTDWKGNRKDFVLSLNEHKLDAFFKSVLKNYSEAMNTECYLDFELEKISRSAVWLAKKKYIEDVVFKSPNVHYESTSKISSKGTEIIQSSTPIFVREKLKELMKYVICEEDVQASKVVNKLSELKRQFKLQEIDNISISYRVNNYRKYILNDYDIFEINTGCPFNVRAAGYYNYLLNNSKYKEKYRMIEDSDKIKIYITENQANNYFAYLPGEFPKEIAPKIDYDQQFERVMIDPLNRILIAVGLPPLTSALFYKKSLF